MDGPTTKPELKTFQAVEYYTKMCRYFGSLMDASLDRLQIKVDYRCSKFFNKPDSKSQYGYSMTALFKKLYSCYLLDSGMNREKARNILTVNTTFRLV